MNQSDLSCKSRRSLRWTSCDYSSQGAYFVTLCSQQRRCVFGRVLAGAMTPNIYGDIAQQMWNDLPQHFPHIALDSFQIMPNHVHAILVISTVGAGFSRPKRNEHEITRDDENRAGEPRPYAATLGQIVGYFKYQSTKRINSYRAESYRAENGLAPVRVWQRNYHDRVLRDERELNGARRYIAENPLRWKDDENHPK